MVRKTEIHLAVKTFAKEIRVSAYLILGPVGTHKGVELRKVANEINYIRWIFLKEEYSGPTVLNCVLVYSKNQCSMDMKGSDA